jgi:hypothetical protein
VLPSPLEQEYVMAIDRVDAWEVEYSWLWHSPA